MGRTKLFTDEEAISSIADVFTAHGYGATSIAMLTDATGLGKQSLYNSLGDKQTLYLKSVDHVTARYGEIVNQMDAAPSGFAAIELFFERIVMVCASNDPIENACIICSGLLEGIDDVVINGTLCTKWGMTHAVLVTAIKRGQADGSIVAAESATELADFLMATMSGLRVVSRAIRQPARLRKTVTRALNMLKATEVKSKRK
jgi:TetR/AcrR family transcriptional regulator, transcriptional repressor for nem operon